MIQIHSLARFQREQRSLAQRCLLPFTTFTMPVYRPNWHHRELARRLDRVARGECRRLLLTADHASIQITGPAGLNTYSVLAITSLAFASAGGEDRLTIDFANGDPLPAGGLTYDGGTGTDTLHVVAPAHDATLTATQVTVGTAARITLSNVDGTSFDLGSGRLSKNGDGTAVLLGTSNYSGGTQVMGGTLKIANADALPDGGSLTVGAGGTYIFDPSPTGASAVSSVTTPVALTANVAISSPVLSAPRTADIVKQSTLGCNSQSPVVPPAAQQRSQSIAAGDLGAPADERLTKSLMPSPPASLPKGEGGYSDSPDQQRRKEVAILALDAVFAQYRQ
jgi:autotransporter-associated beta strand protein